MARLSHKRTPFLKHPNIIDFLRAMSTEAKLLSTTIFMSSLGSAQVRSKVRADGNYSRPVLWKLARHMKPAHLHSVTSDESTHLDHQTTASSLLKHFIAVSPRAYELTIRVIGASVTIDPPGKHLKLARNQYQHSPPRQHHLRFVQVDNIPPIRRSAPRPRTYNTK
ncbi:uncharacterized protein FRV6_11345 [Fusarium oxysporum]|uniref:Uncharacterized protein n=1 Tax=Fusarium oxysporum TaxID=5507 RepID=A0A2H3TEU3_FUSOX|nr:uncharacterized protein FRV6_11345 [Fusarium oxysporum]